MEYNEHGGQCCGRTHIFNIPPYSERAEKDLLNIMQDVRDDLALEQDDFCDEEGIRNDKTFHHCFEITLIDYQCIRDDCAWPKALKRLGWKHVARFLNSNSDNHVNVFLHFSPYSVRSKRPFAW